MDDELFYSHLLKTTSSQIERLLWSVKEESSKRLPATNINDLEVLTQNDNSRTHTWLTADWLEQKKKQLPSIQENSKHEHSDWVDWRK